MVFNGRSGSLLFPADFQIQLFRTAIFPDKRHNHQISGIPVIPYGILRQNRYAKPGRHLQKHRLYLLFPDDYIRNKSTSVIADQYFFRFVIGSPFGLHDDKILPGKIPVLQMILPGKCVSRI